MARPKKPDHERRDSPTLVRMNSVERAQIEHSASMAGMSLAEFFRARALGHRIKSAPQIDRAQMDKATVALLRLGVNLNQLTKHVNAGRPVPSVELADLITRINDTMDRLDESCGDRPGAQL